jgi:Uma2 family endonuclease
MSSALPPAPSLEPDPFRYGWRDVRTTRPDGTEEVERVPLTLEDVLHPQEGDTIPENSRHERHRRHFKDVFEHRLARDATRMSLSDCLIDWGRTDLRGHSPDLIVLERDGPWPWRDWGTLRIQQEHARPLLAIEIVSPHTRSNDVVDKVAHYHRAGVPLYVILDSEYDEAPLRLVGYRWAPGAYTPVPLDEQGRLLLEPFGLHLQVVGDRVAVFDVATGEELGDYVAVCDQLETEVRARKAAEEAQAQAEQAQAEAERQRAEAEQQRDEAERQRMEAEQREREQARALSEAEARRRAEAQARADAERRAQEQAQARAEAEAQLAQLRAELEKLRGAG